MAVRNGQQVWTSKRVSTTTWTGLLNGDTGLPESPGRLSDRSVQVRGTFGAGGSVTIQGSNDNSIWATLRDPAGVALTFTAADIKQILESVNYIRPNVTAGDGTTSIIVILSAASTA